ncbi:penicillin-binding protein 1A [Parachitinimonas caeni]|uniref:Penicillin-binding protein 1A n=1 Tax=Parachitinimonas caeni TaxID=3031301 RepID=A0ABT7DSN6_9NEIS|nr:penicillin-binding protein 1A [Parachitinimonas caeni]MDK2122969.1 penicillin-binding protein 1A [Parachitinimonas caeni]
MFRRWLLVIFALVTALVVAAIGAVAMAIAVTYPRLPSLDVLTDYRPKIPLRVYTSDGALIGEFGEERRAFVPIAQVPQLMKFAILAAEDERFYQHHGVDYIGVARALLSNIVSGQTRSGASTITMQVARNFFLSSERTYSRKFNEVLLATKIDHDLSKDQILELYFNQIYLGQRAYGFAAAAQAYYGKSLNQLTIQEMAMLAGLPKAPSSYNPVVNPKRARLRQLYVLRRMRELNFIDDAQLQAAVEAPSYVRHSAESFAVHGEYVAEMVRQTMVERYKDAAYTQGFKVYTTVVANHQNTAFESARKGLLDYDRRHGYRGPEGYVDIDQAKDKPEEWLDDQLAEVKDAGDLIPAVVLQASPKLVKVYAKGGNLLEIPASGLKFVQAFLSDKQPPASRIRRGAVVRVQLQDKNWQLVQLPQAEVAFLSMNPQNGAILSLIGGFDFGRNNFNHVTQAWRQPGSSFKPFIYSAGIERGFTPATLINDAPLVIDPGQIGGQHWEPKNFDGGFSGMMTMRNALTRSKNLVSIRILQAISPQYAQRHITRFGFDPKQHPAYLTMALGAGIVTPQQLAEGYSVFANTGYRVRSYFIDRIEDSRGQVLAKTEPEVAEKNATRTLDVRNAFIMTSMMHDVTRFGTAAKTNVLGRNDLAGKTGTTSDSHDAWFAGFQPSLVAVAWIGFDQPKSLGGSETGGVAALPIWINYMGKMLKGVPEYIYPVPEGVVTQSIESERGARTEYFLAEFPQTNPELGLDNSSNGNAQSIDEVKDLLF